MNTFWAKMKNVSENYWASFRANIYGLANAYPKQQQQHIRVRCYHQHHLTLLCISIDVSHCISSLL